MSEAGQHYQPAEKENGVNIRLSIADLKAHKFNTGKLAQQLKNPSRDFLKGFIQGTAQDWPERNKLVFKITDGPKDFLRSKMLYSESDRFIGQALCDAVFEDDRAACNEMYKRYMVSLSKDECFTEALAILKRIELVP
jgi:hypothetical protein